MDIRELKTYIYDNDFVEQLLNFIGCHHIKYHGGVSGDNYWTCGNPDGDNQSAIVLYDTENLLLIDYTRQLKNGKTSTDLLDLISYYMKNKTFPEVLKVISEEIGISYYHDFDKDIPESFRILEMLESMGSNYEKHKESPLIPISESILSYYKPYVNNVFYEDNIDYLTQKEFEIGYDPYSNRYTIPIRSEIGDLVGVKGRYFYRNVPANENKYIYIEPCAKSKVLYGLYKTIDYIKKTGVVYVGEAEKFVLQLWSYGYKNCVSTGGKKISMQQIAMLSKLDVKIVFCYDKDVTKEEIENISNMFIEGIPIYYMYDEDNKLVNYHESPSDNLNNWKYLIEHNIYRIK